MASSHPIVPVPFEGEPLHAARGEAGRAWVAVRRLCEAIGIGPGTPRVRLADKAWATTGMIPVVDASGRRRRHFRTGLDRPPLWPATIAPGRVAASVRTKRTRLQAACARTLATHFVGRPLRESFAPPQRRVATHLPPGSSAVIAASLVTMLVPEDRCYRHTTGVRPGDRPCASVGLCWHHARKERGFVRRPIGQAPIWLPDCGEERPVPV